MAVAKGEFEIEFTDDGKVKVESGDMGGVQHKSADEFMKMLQQVLGGEVVEAKIEKGHTHTHSHGHTHGGHRHHH